MSEVETSPSGGTVIVTFALPDESRSFVPTLADVGTLHRGRPPMLPTFVGRAGTRTIVVVHTGVGDTCVGRARLQEMIGGAANLRGVVSAGYAGGLASHLLVGDLVLGVNFCDPPLARLAGDLLADAPVCAGAITTQDTMALTAAAKAALALRTGALAVDMETAWIAALCSAAGVAMLSLRVISDAANQDLPVPGHILFNAVRQRPRYLALPAWLLAHPGRILPFAAFVRGLRPARERLARALQRIVASL